MLKTEDVLEILSIPLLGIIPESEEVLRASNVGSPITIANPLSAAARAYADAARRLSGETVVLTVPSDKTEPASASCSCGGPHEPLQPVPERAGSAPVARDRLQILLAHERTIAGGSDLVGVLREEILAVIKKHVQVDHDKVQVKMERGESVSTLEVEIEIPTPIKKMKAATRPKVAAAAAATAAS